MVEDSAGRRPFMRGIMVHSLMARGVDFEVAFATAGEVRKRVVGRGVVDRAELAKLVREILGDDALHEHQPPLPPLVGRIHVTRDGRGVPDWLPGGQWLPPPVTNKTALRPISCAAHEFRSRRVALCAK